MAAKYYIYRNLNRGKVFSIKHRGKVIDRREMIEAFGVEFRVSRTGRERVLREGKRNVHAFAVAEAYGSAIQGGDQPVDTSTMVPVWYNPFKTEQFRAGDIDIFNADRVLFADGKCFIHEN